MLLASNLVMGCGTTDRKIIAFDGRSEDRSGRETTVRKRRVERFQSLYPKNQNGDRKELETTQCGNNL